MNIFGNSRISIDDLAAAMIVDPDMIDMEDMFMYLMAEAENQEVPVHRQYDSFELENFSETEFRSMFRFKKRDIADLSKHLRLDEEYEAKIK